MDYDYYPAFFGLHFLGLLVALLVGAAIGRRLAWRRMRRWGGPGPWAYQGRGPCCAYGGMTATPPPAPGVVAADGNAASPAAGQPPEAKA